MMYNLSKIIAVVLLLQICPFITSTPTEKSSLSPQNKTNITNNVTISNSNGHNATNKTEVLQEGGGQIDAQVKAAVSQSHSRGREGEIVSDKPTASNNKTVNSLPSVSTSSGVEIQGSSSTASSSIPIYEDKPPTSNNSSKTAEHRTISARKGVNLTEFMEHEAKLNESAAKPKPKKPTVTIASDEEPYAPSHFQAKSNLSASQSIPKVPSLDMLNENNNEGNTQKYVVPIVIVILSVPFVAILISVLYKRGSEWWKYRHYRRMDFLINGMYDN